MKSRWTAADIPNLAGYVAVVTGASSGTGFQIAVQLATHGAHVVLASRDQSRSTRAADRISTSAPGRGIETQRLDLASLESVRRFAHTFRERHTGLDILVNNAGIVGGPRRLTSDGFEAHLGTNHLGHFALTGLLLPALLSRPRARVVTISSGLAAQATIDFDDLHSQRRYRMTEAYGQSKLANLLFAAELSRRAQDAGTGIASLAAHPGVARTNLLVNKETDWGRTRGRTENAVRLVQLLFGQSPAKAALPALYQATDPAVRVDGYIGTKGHMRGYPAPCRIPPAALDRAAAQRLWQISAELTDVHYDFGNSFRGGPTDGGDDPRGRASASAPPTSAPHRPR
jgi:NAD(P)-dependent dehydrogenase (short-subunit alcohol dehydrogenase family)